MKAALTWMAVFTAAAGVWLAVMENTLKHVGCRDEFFGVLAVAEAGRECRKLAK